MTEPIVRSVDVQADPERVFELLTVPRELVRWWPDVAEIEPRTGGAVRMEFMGGEAVVNATVTTYDPPRSLGMSWYPSAKPDVETSILFTVTPLDGGGSRLELVHSGWEHAPDLRENHEQGWAHFLSRLPEAA